MPLYLHLKLKNEEWDFLGEDGEVGMELGSMLDFTYELIQLLQQSRICKSSPFYRQEKLAAW